MARAQTRHPLKTHKIVGPGGQECDLPCCNYCGVEIHEVELLVLARIHKGRPFPEKFPWDEFLALCATCRQARGFAEETYLLVPVKAGSSYVEALRVQLAELTAIDALGTIVPPSG